MDLYSVLCGSLHGSDAYMYMDSWVPLLSTWNCHILIGYAPIQTKKFF